jgi:hypothetical protein
MARRNSKSQGFVASCGRARALPHPAAIAAFSNSFSYFLNYRKLTIGIPADCFRRNQLRFSMGELHHPLFANVLAALLHLETRSLTLKRVQPGQPAILKCK